MQLRFLTLTALLACALTAASVPTGLPTAEPLLDRSFARLYNSDFETSKRLATEHIDRHPGDPLGYSVRAAIYLYQELTRQKVLDWERNRSAVLGDKPGEAKLQPVDWKQKLGVSADSRREFELAADKSQQLAEGLLQRDANHRDALLALCLTYGLRRDYDALINKEWKQSLEHGRFAQSYALRLLRVDPSAHDAYLTTGFSEYLLGSLPFFVKWVAKFEDVKGDKERGIKDLEKAANSGRYTRPFARMLLSMIYMKEKRKKDARRILLALKAEFPDNPTFTEELSRLR